MRQRCLHGMTEAIIRVSLPWLKTVMEKEECFTLEAVFLSRT